MDCSEFLSAANCQRLETIILGLVTGLVCYYGPKFADRYLARRSVRKRERTIKEKEAALELLRNVSLSDRAVILYGLTVLLFLTVLGSLAQFATHALELLRDGPNNPSAAIGALIWLIALVLSFYFGTVFRDLREPEKAAARLVAEIEKLRNPPGAPRTGVE